MENDVYLRTFGMKRIRQYLFSWETLAENDKNGKKKLPKQPGNTTGKVMNAWIGDCVNLKVFGNSAVPIPETISSL